MATIDSLVYPTKIDASGWQKGIDEGLKAFDDFDARINARLDKMSIKAPKFEAPSSSGGAADEATKTFSQLGPRLAGSLASAMAPLQSLGSEIQRVGKTLRDSFRFQQNVEALKSIREHWKADLDGMTGEARRFHQSANRYLNADFLKRGNFKRQGAGPEVQVDDRPAAATRGLGAAADSATRSFKTLGAEVGFALGAFSLAYKAIGFLKDGVASATNLGETISKVDAVLGDASAGVKKYADDMASRFGLVKGEVLDVASGIGGLGKGLGKLSGAGLEKFTVQFTQLAADLSSFKNISLAEAGKALQVGLSGEQSDQLKQLGVVTTENTVKAYAYSHGIAKVGDELTEQQKLMARSYLIQKALADASGDLEKTSGGAANMYRKLTGTIANLGTSIGAALLPVLTRGIGALTEFGEWASRAFAGHQGEIEAFFGPISTGIDFVVAGFHNWQAAVEVARLTIIQSLTNIGEYFSVLGPNIATIAEYVAKNWKDLLSDAFNATLAGLKNLWTNWQALGAAIGEWFADPTRGFNFKWTPLLDGFKATAEKFPELLKPALTDMSKQIADAAKPIFDEVNQKADDARKKVEAVAKVAAPDMDEALDGKKAKKAKDGPQFAGALQRNSAEARTVVLNAIGGKGQNKVELNTDKLVNQGAEALRLQREANKMGKKPANVISFP